MISIVIPTYGRPNRVEKTIQSVIEENTKLNLEIIVVDDNGENTENQLNTEKTIKKFNEIKYIKNFKNMGANYSRNVGIKNSQHEYIAFLDDDDRFINGKLEKIINIVKDKKYDLIYSGMNYKNESKCVYKFKKYENIKKEILKENYIGSNSAVIVRKEKAEEVGYFDESLKSCQDWELWIRIIHANGEVLGIDEPLTEYLLNNDDTRITNSLKKRLQGHEKVFEKIKANYLESFSKKERKEIVDGHKKLLADVNYDARNFKEYRKLMHENFNFKLKDVIKYLSSYFGIKANRFLIPKFRIGKV